MSLKHASSFLLAMALLMVSALGSACDARCALGSAGHPQDAMHRGLAEAGMHHCAGSGSDAPDGWNQSHVRGACALDHVWAAIEPAFAHFDVSDLGGVATATLRDARVYDQTAAMMRQPPPLLQAIGTSRTTLPLRI